MSYGIQLQAALQEAIDIARMAGSVIRDCYQADCTTIVKSDGSPVTNADMASNAIIMQSLQKLGSIPIVSEEEAPEYEVRRHWREFWLIDPLDGTTEFLTRSGEFTVNIALVRDSVPVLGVIYAPVLDELFAAAQGFGAIYEQGGARSKIPQLSKTSRIAAKGRSRYPGQMEEFLQANQISEVQTIGAALKFGRLAQGAVSIYPRYLGSKEWDIAAGHAIVKECDCFIIDLTTMQEPLYNKTTFENNYFLACQNSISLESLELIPAGASR